MPMLIMSTLANKMESSIRGKAMAFLEKLGKDDTTPGLHIEPIHNCADSRVRTGRVDQFWRAVLFRIDSQGETYYVVHGIWPHDDAIAKARRAKLTMNPVNGLPEFAEVEVPAPRPAPLIFAAPAAPTAPAVAHESVGSASANATDAATSGTADSGPADEPEPAQPVAPNEPLLVRLGRTREQLVGRLGVPALVADKALAASDENAVLRIATDHEGWLGLLLVDLATTEPIESIATRLDLDKPVQASGDDDADLLQALQRPAAKAQFALIDDQDELRRVIETGDFGKWLVFLHPEQRRFVDRDSGGPYRISGGAGTGKTVVLVHRARALARRDVASRIVLTTFTTNLADSLRENLGLLDPSINQIRTLGDPGVYTTGVDALAAAVIRRAGSLVDEAVSAVLGEGRGNPAGRAKNGGWREVLKAANTILPPQIANETFLKAEYDLVILPNRIVDANGYLRVRRPGRGVALDRTKRAAVWELIAAYRAQNRVDGVLDYGEAAAVAAEYLSGNDITHADHVLVDEGQDLSPAHWRLIRALVAPGPNDIFIAEDAHQRIYGPRTVLSRYGIKVVGRSRRLTLNYRTTAQNLGFAMTILEGGNYVDLEEQAEATGYRSARTGPAPQVLKVPSLTAELDTIATCARSWTGDGEAVAVLVPDHKTLERVVNGLAERGVKAESVDRGKAPSQGVLVMTMHRAKGMEFPKVILTPADSASGQYWKRNLDESERRDADLRDRSLRYVAATRARDQLIVLER